MYEFCGKAITALVGAVVGIAAIAGLVFVIGIIAEFAPTIEVGLGAVADVFTWTREVFEIPLAGIASLFFEPEEAQRIGSGFSILANLFLILGLFAFVFFLTRCIFG